MALQAVESSLLERELGTDLGQSLLGHGTGFAGGRDPVFGGEAACQSISQLAEARHAGLQPGSRGVFQLATEQASRPTGLQLLARPGQVGQHAG